MEVMMANLLVTLFFLFYQLSFSWQLLLPNGWKVLFQLKIENQGAAGSLVEKVNPCSQHSGKWIQCPIRTDIPKQKSEAKMEFLTAVTGLMPTGLTNFLDVIKYYLLFLGFK